MALARVPADHFIRFMGGSSVVGSSPAADTPPVTGRFGRSLLVEGFGNIIDFLIKDLSKLPPENGDATTAWRQGLESAVQIHPTGRATDAASGGAPKEQPPRNLSGPRTGRVRNAGKQSVLRLAEGEIRPTRDGGEALRHR